MTSTAIPPTFKAFEYSHHSNDPLAPLRLNPAASLAPLEPTEVTVQVFSAAVNPADYKLVSHGPLVLPKPASPSHPLRMGMDFSGVVVALGSGDIHGVSIGDAVVGMANFDKFGSFAEFLNVDVRYVVPKPIEMSFNEAAAVPLAAQTSYQALTEDGHVQAGQHVLILGGSSATGMFGIQIAKALGAFVSTTCGARNVELVKSLGADQVIEYATERWSEVLKPNSIDFVYDCGMEPNAWNDAAQRVLKPTTGVFTTLLTTDAPIVSPVGATHHQTWIHPSADKLARCFKLIEQGKMKVVIDSVHAFEATPDAVRRQMTGHARGKIVLEIRKGQGDNENWNENEGARW